MGACFCCFSLSKIYSYESHSKRKGSLSVLVLKYELERKIYQTSTKYLVKNISVNHRRHFTLMIGDHIFFVQFALRITSPLFVKLWHVQTFNLYYQRNRKYLRFLPINFEKCKSGLQIKVNSLGAMWAPNFTNITHFGAHSCKNKM
jgi:hypothetical protein